MKGLREVYPYPFVRPGGCIKTHDMTIKQINIKISHGDVPPFLDFNDSFGKIIMNGAWLSTGFYYKVSIVPVRCLIII